MLVADRFWKPTEHQWVDLATAGAVVLLDVEPRTAATAWKGVCEAQLGQWSRGGCLLDFGERAAGHFEAWAVPENDDADHSSPAGEPSIGSIVERLDASPDGHLGHECVAVDVRRWRAFVRALARPLRLRGFVPVGTLTLERYPSIDRVLGPRSLVLLQDDRDGSDVILMRSLLALSSRGRRVVGVIRRADAAAGRGWRVAETGPTFGAAPRGVGGPDAGAEPNPGARMLRGWQSNAQRAARRGRGAHAAELWVRSASGLLDRGEVRAATRACRFASEHLDSSAALRAGVGAVLCRARVELARGAWVGAKRVAAAAELVSACLDDGTAWDQARVLQARALIGLGRVHEALGLVDRVAEHGDVEAERLVARAEAWQSLGDVTAAGRALAPALAAIASRGLRVQARVRLAAARIQIDAGDREAFTLHLDEARRAARRVRAAPLAALVRDVEREGARRFRTARNGDRATRGEPGEGAAMREIIQVLRLCQAAADDREGLETVCQFVRHELGAVAVGVNVRPEPLTTLVSVGRGSGCGMAAERVLSLGSSLEPFETEEGYEAGAVVSFAGKAAGAIWVKWPARPSASVSFIVPLLEGVAVAIAPHVLAVCDRRFGDASAPQGELGIIGPSAAMARVRDAIRRAAPAPFPVLVLGDSGCGKELVARAIHLQSPRRQRRFCAVNCAALTDELFEAELFGHAKGAFTGALTERQGLFEEADGGTLFLDEVGELSPRGQAKLLRAIQEREIRRVGENLPRRVDVRIVAATNRTLEVEAGAGRFRRDLLYRIDVLRIQLAPLRERPDDVVALAQRFWRDAVERLGSRATLHPDTLAALARHDWPGNVRELQNVIAAIAVRAPTRGRAGVECLPPAIAPRTTGPEGGKLLEARRRFEEQYVRGVLARTSCRRAAAAQLGVTRQGLAKLLARLGLDEASPRTTPRAVADGSW